MYSFQEQGTRILHRAGKLGGIDDAVMELLAAPMRTLSFRIPLKMDDGSSRIFQAYRVRYNDALGPFRDGTRISPDFDLDEAEGLALVMCIKHAAGRIPAGGGKGGIAADPRSLSRAEFERLCRAYIRGLQPAGPGVDVPGADIGTDLQTMAWMLDEYESITGGHAPAAINDKPSILGGTLGGFDATGNGVFEVFEEAARETGFEIEGARVAIQGFGQVGTVCADRFRSAGCRIVAVSDVSGGFFDGDGLDVDALLDHARQTGGLEGYPHATALGNAELLECDCDVLIPAAVQGVIDENNAEAIRASVIVEAANAPVTVEADALLAERGITVVPDVLANAGSVHLCQMERTQGLSDNYWDRDTIDRLRRKRLVGAYRAAVNTAARHDGASARLGAWINALGRIEEAVKLRGWC